MTPLRRMPPPALVDTTPYDSASDTGRALARRIGRAPTIYASTMPAAEAHVAALVQGHSVIWFPAAWTAHYGPSVRQGYWYAAVLWQDSIHLWALSESGLLATLEAVITHAPNTAPLRGAA